MKQTDHVAIIRVDRNDLADAALHWLAAGEPRITIDRVDAHVVLRSSVLTTGQLEDALLCALTNEGLLVANAGARFDALLDLLA